MAYSWGEREPKQPYNGYMDSDSKERRGSITKGINIAKMIPKKA